MRKRKVIGVFVALIVVIASAVLFVPSRHIQVVGTLPPDDLAQIQKIVWRELRFWVLPKLEWENVFYPHYVFRCVRDYERLHILWIDVKPDGSVEVFAGESKATILSHGHVIDLWKHPDWQITGYGYWASSNVAPHDIHVPPSS
jgi:hypothetical protein